MTWLEVLAVKLVSPRYLAVMRYLPGPGSVSMLVVKVATPELFSVPAPMVVRSLSKYLTVPVGMPVAGGTGLTVAVKVTGCPTMEGLREEDRAVVVPTEDAPAGDAASAIGPATQRPPTAIARAIGHQTRRRPPTLLRIDISPRGHTGTR
jgi:hypothetical protein